MIMIPYLTRLKIKILKEELLYFLNKYNSLDHDGGRYNTTVDVLNERILELQREWNLKDARHRRQVKKIEAKNRKEQPD